MSHNHAPWTHYSFPVDAAELPALHCTAKQSLQDYQNSLLGIGRLLSCSDLSCVTQDDFYNVGLAVETLARLAIDCTDCLYEINKQLAEGTK